MTSVKRVLTFWQKVPSFSLVLGLATAYLFAFYYYVAVDDQQKEDALFSRTKNDINTAIDQYNQYLELTADRLLPSHQDTDRAEQLMDRNLRMLRV